MTAVRERPILFSGPMVTAILRGEKTQTRRVVKGQALEWLAPDMFTPEYVANPENGLCPYGRPGDRLWVRESYRVMRPHGVDEVQYKADWRPLPHDGWKPSIHMPRWASRLTLEIVSVRVERLQDISNQDAEAEGVVWDGRFCLGSSHVVKGTPKVFVSRREAYRDIWDSINAKRGHGWDTNPWVWVIEFTRVDP